MPLQSYRPRSSSEIVDAAMQLFRRHYTPLVATMAVGYLPVVVFFVVFRDRLGLMPAMQNPATPPAQVLAQMAPLMGISFVLLLWFQIVSGTLAVAVSTAYLDDKVDVGLSLRTGFRRAPVLLAAGFVKLLAVFGAMMLAMVGGLIIALIIALIFTFAGLKGTGAQAVMAVLIAIPMMIVMFGALLLVYARLASVPAATVLESEGLGIRRAWRLSAGNGRRVLATLVLTWVIYFIGLAIVASIGLGVMRSLIVYQLLGAAYNILVFPFVAAAQTLVYYDLRIRKEGLDLELMARQPSAAAMAPLSP